MLKSRGLIVDCINRWPDAKESFRECFKGCYNHFFLHLLPFYVLSEKLSVDEFWERYLEEATTKRWSEISKESGLHNISHVNKAIIHAPGVFDYRDYRRTLITYMENRPIYYPQDDDLDPFTLVKVLEALYLRGVSEVYLAALGEQEIFCISTKLSPKDIGLVNQRFNPMHLYTTDHEFLYTTWHDYPCAVIAANDAKLVDFVVSHTDLEGFYLKNEGIDWTA